MRKIEAFRNDSLYELQRIVNAFMAKSKNPRCVGYATAVSYRSNGLSSRNEISYSAIVEYDA